MAGLGLQSAFGGAALDQALQQMVAERRLRELQDEAKARADAELKMRQNADVRAQSADTRAADEAGVKYAMLKGELTAAQPDAGPGEGGSMLSGKIPQGVPVANPTLPGFKGIPQAAIASTGPQPTVNPWDHPTMQLPDAFGQKGSTIRLRSLKEQTDAARIAKMPATITTRPGETVLGQESGGEYSPIATGGPQQNKLEAPKEYEITGPDGKKRNAMLSFDAARNNYFEAGSQTPVQGSVKPVHEVDPTLQAIRELQLQQAKDKNKVDPEAVAFWGRQVLQDPANMGLVKSPAMQQAVSGWIATNGGDVNRLTSAGRQMKELATVVAPHIDTVEAEADRLEKLGLLGPIGSRWREFVAKKIGAGEFAGGNEKNAELIGKFQSDVGLLITAVARVHGGARAGGSPTMIKHLEELLNAGAADLGQFKGQLASFRDFITTYAGMGGGGDQTPSTPHEEQWMPDGKGGFAPKGNAFGLNVNAPPIKIGGGG